MIYSPGNLHSGNCVGVIDIRTWIFGSIGTINLAFSFLSGAFLVLVLKVDCRLREKSDYSHSQTRLIVWITHHSLRSHWSLEGNLIFWWEASLLHFMQWDEMSEFLKQFKRSVLVLYHTSDNEDENTINRLHVCAILLPILEGISVQSVLIRLSKIPNQRLRSRILIVFTYKGEILPFMSLFAPFWRRLHLARDCSMSRGLVMPLFPSRLWEDTWELRPSTSLRQTSDVCVCSC